MGNKIWIAMLAFCALVFTCLGLGVGIWRLVDHDSVWAVLPGTGMMCLFTWRCIERIKSRIKYGPKGPPPNPHAIADIDFTKAEK